MPGPNIELHRRALRAFAERDIDALMALADPKIEFNSEIAAVGGGVYHGHDGVRCWISDLEDAWGDEFQAEPDAFFDLGEQTLLFYVLHTRGRQSGAEVTMPLAQVCRWINSLCVFFKVYVDRKESLRDLGISEGELEPIAP